MTGTRTLCKESERFGQKNGSDTLRLTDRTSLKHSYFTYTVIDLAADDGLSGKILYGERKEGRSVYLPELYSDRSCSFHVDPEPLTSEKDGLVSIRQVRLH